MVFGTLLSLTRARQEPETVTGDLPPVSILKPLKGADAGLERNLETFFNLAYPRYELIFSVADASDPARAVAARLIAKYPQVPARLIIGEVEIGPNPKVNNLVHSYREARFDCLLISDSNVRVTPHYLSHVVAHLGAEVGMVTAVVAGRGGSGLGGHLESVFLNSHYARWMRIAFFMKCPVVVGKSMCFRRSTAERFGGIQNLARYIAEDYMAGQAMHRLGLKVVAMNEPIPQFIGSHEIRSFWSRHLRWGRIRKAQAPLAFVVEPLLGSILSGLIGAWAFHEWLGASFLTFLAAHLVIWLLFDWLLIRELNEDADPSTFFVWFLREILAVPLWVHIACGSSIQWRGNRLRILRGGLVVPW